MIKRSFKKPVEVSRKCIFCKQEKTVLVEEKDLKKYTGGKIQECFQYLDANERELLISGICGSCYDKLIPEEM